MLRRPLALLLLGTFLGGCNGARKPSAVQPSNAVAPVDPWVAVWTDPKNPAPALLWNGDCGLRIARNGGGHGLPAFWAGLRENSGGEKLLSTKSPLPDGPLFDPDKVSGYRQAIDFRTGILTTQFSSEGRGTEVQEAMNPAEFGDHEVGVVWGSPTTVEAVIASPKNEVTQSKGDFQEFPAANARDSGVAILAASRLAWGDRWTTDIEVDGPSADQQAIHSELFYLRSLINSDRTEPSNAKSRLPMPIQLGPFGLSNSGYGGHVFWDADVWVMPAMAFIDPEASRWIETYRLSRLEAYEQNGVVHVPWESSVSGVEVAPPKLRPDPRKEIHVTGSVAWAIKDAECLGLMDSSSKDPWGDLHGQVRRFVAGAANYYLQRSDLRSDGFRELKGVVSPNEWVTADNDLYTNLVAQWTINGGSWDTKNGEFALPHDNNTFLAYDHDPVTSYKQAAAELAIYPLQYPPAEREAKAMMNRIAPHVSKFGPAMTDSLHAIIWARLGDTDLAYDAWEHSWRDFMKPPLMMFGEHRVGDQNYFVTGAAGSLQAVIYGFLGFRIDDARDPHAGWSTPLEEGKWLNITPHLPKEWKSARFKGFTVLGKRYALTATAAGVKVVRQPNSVGIR
jgi:trehalose/maltose hydrolase-like predicted phosphorylase